MTLDSDAAGELVVALAGYERVLTRRGRRPAPAMGVLRRLATAVWDGTQRRSTELGDEPSHGSPQHEQGSHVQRHESPPLEDYGTVARVLKCDERTVRELVKRGELPAVRVGRSPLIHRADLATFIDRRRREGAA